MLTPDFTGSFEERMTQLIPILGDKKDWTIIGSSFGGLMGTVVHLRTSEPGAEVDPARPRLDAAEPFALTLTRNLFPFQRSSSTGRWMMSCRLNPCARSRKDFHQSQLSSSWMMITACKKHLKNWIGKRSLAINIQTLESDQRFERPDLESETT